MNALVLGGSGLVGRYLVARLIKDGHAVDVLTRDAARVSGSGARALVADLSQPDWLTRAGIGLANYDAIFHLAYATRTDEQYNRTVTVDSVRAVMDGLRTLSDGKPRHVVYIGSMVVFGATPADSVVTEQSARVGDTTYAANKLAATQLALEPMPHVHRSVLHPTGVYDASSRRIKQYRGLLESNYIPMRHGGSGFNNIVHADDVALAALMCLDRARRDPAPHGEEFIINGEVVVYRDWFAQLAETVENKSWLRLPPLARPLCRGPVRRLLNAAGVCCPLPIPDYKLSAYEMQTEFSSAKARTHFGYAPQRPSFREMCASLRTPPSRA